MRTNGHNGAIAGDKGFTLVEVMMVTAISAFVFAGVLSAYTFLGRGLVREGYDEQAESGSRKAIFYFTRDVSAAQSIAVQTSQPQITLTIPTQPTGTVTVTYSYDSTNQILNRTASNGIGSGNLLSTSQSGLTELNLTFLFYDYYGNKITSFPAGLGIKQAMMTYTATTGSAVSGAQSKMTVSSPLVILRNKLNLL